MEEGRQAGRLEVWNKEERKAGWRYGRRKAAGRQEGRLEVWKNYGEVRMKLYHVGKLTKSD